MASISICMIVKNEEEYLEKCLNSVTNLADEIIIVDTGSTDKTKEIATKFTSRIFDFSWQDDFAAARNLSLSKASGDWILVLDADEGISSSDCEKIKKVIKMREAQAYYLIQRHYTNNTGMVGWKSSLNDYYKESKIAAGFVETPILRLFENKKEHFFEGKIHETIENSIRKANGKVFMTDIVIHHYGMLKTKEKNLEKKEKYAKLLDEKIKEKSQEKSEYYVLYELARELIAKEDFSGAKENLRKSIELNSEYAGSLLLLSGIYIKEKNYDEAEKLLLRALKVNRNEKNSNIMPDVYNNLGVIYSERNELNRAIKQFEKALQLNSQSADYNFNLGLVYIKIGKQNKAEIYLRKAVELNPEYAKRVKFNS